MTGDPTDTELGTATPEASVLERRYRGWLRLLPPEYRAKWEEEMVSTFLATVPDDFPDFLDYGRPPLTEVASVLGLAVRLRLGGMPTQRSQQWGGAARYVALTGMLVNAVVAGMGLVPLLGYLLVGGAFEPDPLNPEHVIFTRTSGSMAVLDLSRTYETLLALLWIAAYFALVLGRYRSARWLGLAGLVSSLLSLCFDLITGRAGPGGSWISPSQVVFLLVSALPLAAVVAFRPNGPPVRRRAWLWAGVIGLGLSPVLALAPLLVVNQYVTTVERYLRLLALDWVNTCTVALVVAAVVASRRAVADRAAWRLALIVLAGVLALLSLVMAVEELPFIGHAGLRYREVVGLRGMQLLILTGLAGWQFVALRRP